MLWDWGYAIDILPELLRGLLLTVQATLLGSAVAYALGLVFALVRRSRIPVLSQAVWLLVEFVRSTPLLVQLYFLYFVLPDLGIRFDALTTGVIGLGLHYACYTAEVYRAGIEAVPKGQWEACTALSLPRSRVWTGVILPQAVTRVLPALGNYMISMFKETPLLLAISVMELVGAAREAGSETFRLIEPLTMAGIFFLLVSYPSAVLLRRVESRLAFAH